MSRSVMPSQHAFSMVPSAQIERSQFNRSHGYKTTFNAGYLIPVFFDEVLPGDTFNLRMSAFARLATPIAPVMDNLFLESFFFFVPNRLLWSNWEKFNGAQDNPGDPTDFVIPQVLINPGVSGEVTGSLGDYFGLPVGIPTSGGSYAPYYVNALHYRAYNLIWNEWFRDQNLQNSVTVDLGDGPDSYGSYGLLKRGKRHDYFTSCLPFPQKGPSVSLPLGSTAPIVLSSGIPLVNDGNRFMLSDSTAAGGNRDGFSYVSGDDHAYYSPTVPSVNAATLYYGGNHAGGVQTEIGGIEIPIEAGGYMHADLSGATASTINQLRQAFQIQKLLERDARGGTRYTEILRSHFQVVSPDFRLQRPEYLGGGSTPVNIHPVAQTSSTDVTSPQGNLAAFGTCSAMGHGFVKSFVEHGVLLGLISVRADLNYQQGINKMWQRQTRFDYYWPSFAHLGEQAVTNQEIYFQNVPVDDGAVFGYQERYAEMRYKPSLVTGNFRSHPTIGGSLDIWHLAEDFGSLPVLGSTFIQDNPPIYRIKAVESEPDFLFDSFFDLKCARPMPTYGVPGFIDRF